jgi:hypothetical protein
MHFSSAHNKMVREP